MNMNLEFKILNISRKPQQSGFSLLETLVAISILTLAITGTLSVVATNVTTASNAKDRITASYLAQDALEYVRNMRDTGAIQRGKGEQGACGNQHPPDWCSDWLGELADCLGDDIGDACAIDTTKDFDNAVLSDGSQMLFFDNDVDAGFYTYESSGNIETPFSREVLVNEIESDQEAVITVRMRWQPQLIPHEIIISEHIFNWQAEL